MRYQILDNFLSKEECEQLIELAKPKLEPSTSWDIKIASARITDYRTSEQMYFTLGENELVRSIEERIAQLTSIPVINGEGLQVLRYSGGGHYRTHCDWFDPNYKGNKPVLEHGGQRIMTVIMYLNDVQKGGETYFPKGIPEGLPLSDDEKRVMKGFKVIPKQGRALWFHNVDEQGTPDPTTAHSGEDVLKDEKFIMTKWIRERPYV
jgi:prolyl 4-hydroxylase